MDSRLSPQRIPNHFRYQVYIEEEIAKAEKLFPAQYRYLVKLANREAKITEEEKLLGEKQLKELSSTELVDLGLIFMEVGNWPAVNSLASLVQTREEQSSSDTDSKGMLATVAYMRGTRLRELNDCAAAHVEFKKAWEFAQSDWLKSNILRNVGLTYLKPQEFTAAADEFKKAYEFTRTHSAEELRGALPALLNYQALCTTRAALSQKQDPTEGLALFELTTKLYETIFAEKQFSKDAQLKCHDWQSHQCHRGMILCEIAEQNPEDKEENPKRLRQAETLILGALEGRRANKADDQRLGDSCQWLGRIYSGLGQWEQAKEYFETALGHFRKSFPNDPNAKQITDVKKRLSDLPIAPKPWISLTDSASSSMAPSDKSAVQSSTLTITQPH